MNIENVVRDTDSPEYKQDELAEHKNSSVLERLRSCNWFNIATLSCLWLAYLLCNMSYSIAAAFFPEEVCGHAHSTACMHGSIKTDRVLRQPAMVNAT